MSRQKGKAPALPRRAVIRCSIIFVLGVVVVLAAYISGIKFVTVDGTSMSPTLVDGQRLITLPPRGEDDVQLQGCPICLIRLDSGKYVVKRLIGLPGQTVHLIEGDTYVDGHIVMERTTESYDNLIVSLGTDEYFFLGDNREDSFDGRYWSPKYLHFESIKGIVKNSQLF